MTTERLFRILLRRWYVVLIGALLTVPTAERAYSHECLYWSQVDVLFVAPPTGREPNTIEANTSGLTSITGMVAAEINKASDAPLTSSAGATLAGQGVRDGFQIRLPNSGGQWAQNFDRPVLDVQVISPDPETTRQRTVEIVARVEAVLEQLQVADGVRKQDTITTVSAPTSAQIFKLGGNPTRAAVVVLLLGAWLTILSSVAVDLVLRRLRRRRLSPQTSDADADAGAAKPVDVGA